MNDYSDFTQPPDIHGICFEKSMGSNIVVTDIVHCNFVKCILVLELITPMCISQLMF